MNRTMNQDDVTTPRTGHISDHNRRYSDSQIAAQFDGKTLDQDI